MLQFPHVLFIHGIKETAGGRKSVELTCIQVVWGPVAGGTGHLSNQRLVSEELIQIWVLFFFSFFYERADKERWKMQSKNESLRKPKTEGNRRWETEERGKQKGGNSNLPIEITRGKCSSEKKRGYDLCQRTSFHATATTGLHYSALQRERQRKIVGGKEKK